MCSRYLKVGLVLVAFLAISACETPADNNIEKARQCLDNASQLAATNPSGAAAIASDACEPLVENVQTVEAGLIGVGIVLVEEQKLANLTAVENAVSAGSNAIATSISFLVFSAPAHVTNLINYANLSQDAGSVELASIITLAFYANSIAPINSGSSPAAIAGAVSGLIGTPNAPAAAQALLNAQTSACSGGSSSTLCTDLTNAIGGGTDPTTILTNAAAYIAAGG